MLRRTSISFSSPFHRKPIPIQNFPDLTLRSNIPQGTHPTLDSVDGATAPNPVAEAGAESDLDFELAYPIIYPQGTVLFQTDDDVYQAEEANGTVVTSLLVF